jgi:hypothetical protein
MFRKSDQNDSEKWPNFEPLSENMDRGFFWSLNIWPFSPNVEISPNLVTFNLQYVVIIFSQMSKFRVIWSPCICNML